MENESTSPGWYNDPSGLIRTQAYWDGEQWTGETRVQMEGNAKGWHKDPSGLEGAKAYWDGEKWTGETRSGPTRSGPYLIDQVEWEHFAVIALVAGVLSSSSVPVV